MYAVKCVNTHWGTKKSLIVTVCLKQETYAAAFKFPDKKIKLVRQKEVLFFP